MSLLQISDPHFGTEQAPVVEALVRMVHAERPTLVVLSGDLTQRATPEQFEAARRFVERLGVPHCLAIPGNHDIPLFNLPARLLDPYRNFRRAFGEDLEPAFESPDWLVLTLNTTRRWRHKDGAVAAAQIERVAARLEQARAGQLRVVVVHQPAAVDRVQDQPDLLHGRVAALRRWSAAGADLILGGHIHLPFVLPLHDADRTLPRRLWVVQAGTAVSSRLRHEAGNSVNLIRSAAAAVPAVCSVERWDFASASGRFEPVQIRPLPIGPLNDAD